MSDPDPARRIAPRWRDPGAGYVLAGIAVLAVFLLSSSRESPRHLVCEVVDVSVLKSMFWRIAEGERPNGRERISLQLHVACPDQSSEEVLVGEIRIGPAERADIVPSNGYEGAGDSDADTTDRPRSATVKWDFELERPSAGFTLDDIASVLDSSRPFAVQFAFWNGKDYVAHSDWIDLDRWRAKLSTELRRHR